jgi:hypothetical protein
MQSAQCYSQECDLFFMYKSSYERLILKKNSQHQTLNKMRDYAYMKLKTRNERLNNQIDFFGTLETKFEILNGKKVTNELRYQLRNMLRPKSSINKLKPVLNSENNQNTEINKEEVGFIRESIDRNVSENILPVNSIDITLPLKLSNVKIARFSIDEPFLPLDLLSKLSRRGKSSQEIKNNDNNQLGFSIKLSGLKEVLIRAEISNSSQTDSASSSTVPNKKV